MILLARCTRSINENEPLFLALFFHKSSSTMSAIDRKIQFSQPNICFRFRWGFSRVPNTLPWCVPRRGSCPSAVLEMMSAAITAPLKNRNAVCEASNLWASLVENADFDFETTSSTSDGIFQMSSSRSGEERNCSNRTVAAYRCTLQLEHEPVTCLSPLSIHAGLSSL